MPRRVDKETTNSFFTERFGGFQPMQAFNEHEPSAVRPYQDLSHSVLKCQAPNA
jgi:hypothetical protein